jgi:hypothetical protein
MIDYNTITTISKNHNYEETILENSTLKRKNKLLFATLIIVGLGFLRTAFYLINEENKQSKNN